MDILFHPNVDPEVKDAKKTQSKPKFKPKVKSRGTAKAGPSKTQQKPELKEPRKKAELDEQEQPDVSMKEKQPEFQVKEEPFENDALKTMDPKPIVEQLDSQPFVDGQLDVKPKVDMVDMAEEPSSHLDATVKQEPEDQASIKPEDVEMTEGDATLCMEDTVVREIDVFFCPNINQDTKLYLLQYPLRPYWRPYGLEERCDEVRVKPKLTQLEMDLVVDTTGENYDHDADDYLQIKKQTLSSSKIAMSTNYAVGLLRGNKLHIAPLDAILQMRTSMKYLDEADVKRRSAKKLIEDEDVVDAEGDDEEEKDENTQLVALKVEVKKQETERQEQIRLQSHAYLKQLDAAEPWIPLVTHGTDSPITDDIRRILTSMAADKLPFNMPMSDYLNHLVPGRASPSSHDEASQDANAGEGLSRSFLDTLPLEDRFIKLLSKGRVHILQFERLMKLAPPGCKEEEVLTVLQELALLVQGCWVAPSSFRYTGQICIVRDYILSLFAKNRVIYHDQLEELQVPKEMIREVLVPLAVQRPAERGWQFQETTDRSFLKRYQAIAKEQMQRWAENEEQIKMAALSLKIGTSTNKSSSVNKNMSPNPIGGMLSRAKLSTLSAFSGQWTMPEETRDALPGALNEIFSKHNVCNLQVIRQSLRELAITKAAANNANPKVVAAAVAAAKAANSTTPELIAAISQVASNIDGIFFLTKLGNPNVDAFRDVVIALLRAKGPQTGLKRLDIIEASKIALKGEVQANVYQKVMKELCYTKGGAWVLKPGDGRPS